MQMSGWGLARDKGTIGKWDVEGKKETLRLIVVNKMTEQTDTHTHGYNIDRGGHFCAH